MSNMTKQALKQALMNLLENEPLDNITVNKIAAECNVNRNTFYYHFHDIYELLHYLLEEETRLFLSGDDPDMPWRDRYHRLYLYMKEHQKLIYHVYYSMEREYLERFLFESIHKIIVERVESEMKGYDIPRARVEIFCDAIDYAYVGYFMNWIGNGMKEDLEEKFEDILHLAQVNKEAILTLLAQK